MAENGGEREMTKSRANGSNESGSGMA